MNKNIEFYNNNSNNQGIKLYEEKNTDCEFMQLETNTCHKANSNLFNIF